MNFITKKKWLIITEDNINDSLKKHSNIDVLKIKIDKQLIIKINKDYKENYDYIFFANGCKYSNELVNYLPIYFITNYLFINECLVNSILMESINGTLNSIRVVEVGIILKHILQNDIKEEKFKFYKEINKLKKIYKCTHYDIYCFKKNICHSIEEHYCSNKILNKIWFKFNRQKIIKKVLYKILEDVIYKMKSTNELVPKEFIGTII